MKREIAHLCTDDNPQDKSRDTPEAPAAVAQPETSASTSAVGFGANDPLPASTPLLSENTGYPDPQPASSNADTSYYNCQSVGMAKDTES